MCCSAQEANIYLLAPEVAVLAPTIGLSGCLRQFHDNIGFNLIYQAYLIEVTPYIEYHIEGCKCKCYDLAKFCNCREASADAG